MTETMVRMARCGYFARCGSERDSETARREEAFFEDLSAGHTDEICRVCRYSRTGHDVFEGKTSGLLSGKWPRGIEPHEFEAKTEGEPYDRYYCGCYGWE